LKGSNYCGEHQPDFGDKKVAKRVPKGIGGMRKAAAKKAAKKTAKKTPKRTVGSKSKSKLRARKG